MVANVNVPPDPVEVGTDPTAAAIRRRELPHPADRSGFEVSQRLHTPVWVFDIDDCRVVWANAAGLALWRSDGLAELTSRDMGVDMSPAVRTRLLQYRDDLARGAGEFSEVWTIYPRGVPATLRVIFSGHRLPGGRFAMLCEALAELNDTPERVRSAEALLYTPVMITLYDPDGRVLYRNPAARRAIGEEERLADRFLDGEAHGCLTARLAESGEARLVARVVTPSGPRWHEIAASNCRDAVSGRPAVLISETDVDAHKQAEAQVRYLAEHDTLTGLPNRSFLQTEVERRLEAARAGERPIGLLFIDLDRFKTINDSLGHACGDALLVEAARRIGAVTGAADFVARLGGDEFLVAVALGDDDRRAHQIARQILDQFERPVRTGGLELVLSASIGISIFPYDGDDLDTLMRHADLAMYEAKERGRNRIAGFTTEMKAEVEAQMELESGLRRALDHGEFELWYQPRLSIDAARITGAEALLRWHHPTRGLVLPGAFIPNAEKTGLIDRIGASVLREAARQQREWRENGHDITVSINLSARQFRDPRLLRSVVDTIAATRADPRRLQIEITESMLVGDDPTTSDTLAGLAALGFSIAIDDFGTGYSNLGTIQRHPIDTLKIDRSFVATLETRPALAELIIGMCRLLDMRIVAEGVETAEQLAWLKARNCQEYQGYLFSPAVPADAFSDYLARQTALETVARLKRLPADAPLWDLAPVVDRTEDVDWSRPESVGAKVRRLRASGAIEGFG